MIVWAFRFEGGTLETLSPQEQQVLNRLYTWQSGTNGTFTFSAKWMREQYGRNSTAIISKLRENGLLQMVEAEQFFSGTTHKGRCRRYRLTKKASKRSKKVITTQDNDYTRTRERTNLAGIGYFIEPKGDDTRHYTDFSQLSSTEKAKVTIDGEQLVEIDITNCHFLPLVPLLRKLPLNKHEKDLCDSILAGTMYDELAEICRLDRKTVVKKAMVKILNSPYNRVAFSKWDAEEGQAYYENNEDRGKTQFRQMFQRFFPHIYTYFRELGKTKSGYLLGVEYEGKIRDKTQQRFLKKYGYQPLDCHDGFFVKESDYHRFMSVLFKVAKNIPVKVSRFCAVTNTIKEIKGLISCLYVHSYGEIVEVNPRAEEFFIYDDSGGG